MGHPAFVLVYEKEVDLVSDNSEINRYGLEFGLVDFAFFRIGHYKDDLPDGDVSTKGYGFSLKGLLKLFADPKTRMQLSKFSRYLIDHLNISYDVAKWDAEGEAIDGTKFVKISVSL